MNARDDFLVYVPDGVSLPRLVSGRDAVERALDELGRRAARVRRVTEGELARDLTHDFAPKPVIDYPDDGDWRPAHTRSMARSGAFGTR